MKIPFGGLAYYLALLPPLDLARSSLLSNYFNKSIVQQIFISSDSSS